MSCRPRHQQKAGTDMSFDQSPVAISQAYATKGHIRTVIYLPDNYENIVMSINIIIRGTIATLGEPIVTLPDIESIKGMLLQEAFTYDTTWSARLQPRVSTQVINGNQFKLVSNAETDQDITIDIIAAEDQYLVGTINCEVAAVYAKRQNFSGFRFGPVRPVE